MKISDKDTFFWVVSCSTVPTNTWYRRSYHNQMVYNQMVFLSVRILVLELCPLCVHLRTPFWGGGDCHPIPKETVSSTFDLSLQDHLLRISLLILSSNSIIYIKKVSLFSHCKELILWEFFGVFLLCIKKESSDYFLKWLYQRNNPLIISWSILLSL